MSALAFQVWMYIFGTSNSQFIFINKDGDNAKTNLRRLRDLIDLLPEYMQSKSFVNNDGTREKGKENATEITNPVTSNSIITKLKATSYDRALSLARGLSAPVKCVLGINSFNCWEILLGQSAAKTYIGKVQRLSKT